MLVNISWKARNRKSDLTLSDLARLLMKCCRFVVRIGAAMLPDSGKAVLKIKRTLTSIKGDVRELTPSTINRYLDRLDAADQAKAWWVANR